MNLYSEFTKYCRFWFKIFQNVMWKNSIFLTSEARLSPNLQNWTKLLRFYNSGLSGQLSFEWPDWKSLGLNYSIIHTCDSASGNTWDSKVRGFDSTLTRDSKFSQGSIGFWIIRSNRYIAEIERRFSKGLEGMTNISNMRQSCGPATAPAAALHSGFFFGFGSLVGV